MNRLKAEISLTLLDGERRVRRLREFNERTHTRLFVHELRSPFNENTEQLVASVQVDTPYWRQVEERVHKIQEQLEAEDFIVPRVKVTFPFRDVAILRDQKRVPLYLQGVRVLNLAEEKDDELLKVCQEYELAVAYDFPALLPGRRTWYVSKNFCYKAAGFDAEGRFTLVNMALMPLGAITPHDLGLQCVIHDSNENGDDIWLPPR